MNPAQIPILLLHGLIGDLSVPDIVRHFGDTPVYAPAMLGYGEFRDHPTDGLTLVDQVEHVARWLRKRWDGPVHLVGHSVGGAVAVLFARSHLLLSYSLTTVEGNFTLNDAFWTRQLSGMPLAQVEALLASYQNDPAGWLAKSGVPATPRTLALARAWLAHQPASTLQAQARAVVSATGDDDYLRMVRSLARSHVPIHLLSGARSQAGWHVPDWLRALADSDTVITGTGHMMMEEPERFAQAVLAALAPRRLDLNLEGGAGH